jgi:hypothetical protein
MIREFRNNAQSEIETEAAALEAHLAKIRDDVESIGAGVSRFAADPVGTLSPALLVPTINAITRIVRSSKEASGKVTAHD